MNEFFTVEFLCTFGGMVAFVTAITEIVKRYVNVDPKWVALVAAIVGQAAVQFVFLQDFTPSGIVMALFNVVAVLLGSIGAFETVVKPIERKLSDNK